MSSIITSGITTAIGAVGSVFTAVFSTDGEMSAVLPCVGLALGFYSIRVGVGLLKNLIQGY